MWTTIAMSLLDALVVDLVAPPVASTLPDIDRSPVLDEDFCVKKCKQYRQNQFIFYTFKNVSLGMF